jgi:hypothetical protein
MCFTATLHTCYGEIFGRPYNEDTLPIIKDQTAPLQHTNRNDLVKLKKPTPNPQTRR